LDSTNAAAATQPRGGGFADCGYARRFELRSYHPRYKGAQLLLFCSVEEEPSLTAGEDNKKVDPMLRQGKEYLH